MIVLLLVLESGAAETAVKKMVPMRKIWSFMFVVFLRGLWKCEKKERSQSYHIFLQRVSHPQPQFKSAHEPLTAALIDFRKRSYISTNHQKICSTPSRRGVLTLSPDFSPQLSNMFVKVYHSPNGQDPKP